MLLEIQRFEFGEFKLDAREKILTRNGDMISITPKAVNLLLVLLENHGSLVEKKDLMQTVWADSFVEEGNITFTIGLLRKALGDTAQNSRFIETIPKRGYRFIHEIKKISDETTRKSPDALHAVAKRRSTNAIIYLVLILLVGVVVAFGGWLFQLNSTSTQALNFSSPISAEKLSTNGKVFQAVISPDGLNVVYSVGARADKQTVWLRQLDSGNNIQIIPPSDNIYIGFAISPDGNFLYFSRVPKKAENQGDIFRVSIFGGIPEKIISEAQGWISVSPDGAKISFVRCYYRVEESCSLWIADSATGLGEKKIAARPSPFRIGDNEFSPDGQGVTFVAGQSQNQANEFSLLEVDIETGVERELSAEKFFNIKSVEWLPGGNEILVTASRIPNKKFRIWKVSIKSGNAEPLTLDSENYATLSLSNDGSRLVSTRVREEFRLRLMDQVNPSAINEIADASNGAFTPDGRIYFTSVMSGNDDIWSINLDGSAQRQLTNNLAEDSRPVSSNDGNLLFFASNRTGAVQVWQMHGDGTNQTQITKTDGGFPIFVSPDNEWIYYQHGINRTLWRVSPVSGEPQQVLDKSEYRFAISPDGLRVAFYEEKGDEKIINIVSLNDGKTVAAYKIPESEFMIREMIWMQNGLNLAYVLADRDLQLNTIWMQPISGETPKQIADIGDEEVSENGGFAVSADGNTFAIAQGGWRHDAVLITAVP